MLWMRSWGVGLLWFIGLLTFWFSVEFGTWTLPEVTLVLAGTLALLLVLLPKFTIKAFGPIFFHEACRLARRPRLVFLRVLFVVVVTFVLYLVQDATIRQAAREARIPSAREMARFAESSFQSFATIQFLFLMAIAPAYVAGAITDEKERKTLDYLFTTDLTDAEIILGKSASRVAFLLSYVLLGLPILSILQVMGGVDLELVLASTLVTLVSVLAASILGITVSTFKDSTRGAIGVTYLLLGLWLIVMPLMSRYLPGLLHEQGWLDFSLFGYWIDEPRLSDFLGMGSPVHAVVQYFKRGPALTPILVVRFVLFWAFWGLLMLVLSSRILRRQAKTEREVKAVSKSRFNTPKPAIGDSPVLWKELFTDGRAMKGASGMIGVATLYLAVFYFPISQVVLYHWQSIPILNRYEYFQNPYLSQNSINKDKHFLVMISIWTRLATGGIGTLALMAAAVHASAAVTRERDRDTWLSLMATPLSDRAIVYGKWCGAMAAPLFAYAMILAIWVFALGAGAVEPLMILAALVWGLVTVSAFAWMGILSSILSKTSLESSIRTFVFAIFFLVGFWIFVGLFLSTGRGSLAPGDVRNITSFFIAVTPSFMLGWLPLPNFERRSLVPFVQPYGSNYDMQILYPLIGLGLWVALERFLRWLSLKLFIKATQRSETTLSEEKPEVPRGTKGKAAASRVPVAP